MKFSFRVAVLMLLCGFSFAVLAAADDREMADLYNEAGLKALKSGDTEKAAEQFRKALKRYPAHVGAVVALGGILSEELDAAGLARLYAAWLKAFKNLSRPTGKQIKLSERLQKQLKDLKELERIDRKFSKKFAALGKSVRRKDEGAAAEAYNIALALDPNNSSAAREYKKLTGESGKPSKKKKSGKLVGVKLGKMLMSEDFSRPNPDWFMNDGWVFMKDGKYIVKSEKNLSNPRYRFDFKPRNFYIETEIQLGGNVREYTSGGLCFRVNSNQTFYIFHISPKGKYGVWAALNGHKKDLTGKEPADTPINLVKCSVPSRHIKKGKGKNLIAVGFVGTKLYCYINNHMVFSCVDNTVTSGGTIGCSVSGGNNAYAFDNYKVHEATLAK